MRTLLLGCTLGFLALFLLVPLAAVFAEAFRKGPLAWWQSLVTPDTLAAIRLTLLVSVLAVTANTLFGLAAAWALGKFRFRGRQLLISLVDLPFSISPVIAGLVFVLLFGAQGWLGPWLAEHDLRVIFALPGLVLATAFVTFPFVARELLPHFEARGVEDEQAALSLGASAWATFWRVTLPGARWALLYGVVLCNSRAMGEFGAVSMVSGHVRGETNTLPLHVEILYNEYDFVGAFSTASLLALLAFATLLAKSVLERRERASLRAAQAAPPGRIGLEEAA